VVGRDKYGVFPLRGKFLNVKQASVKQLSDNEELSNLKKILGLKQGEEYKDVSDLRYGSIMIITDADVDGIHIKGLLVNLFHTMWPSLLRVENFITCMITPVVKSYKGKKEMCFYTLQDYRKWKDANNGGKGWQIKYFKGLGTSTAKEARSYFSELDKNKIVFKWDEDANEKFRLAFVGSTEKVFDGGGKEVKIEKNGVKKAKTYADLRKEWIEEYDKDSVVDQASDDLTCSDFVSKELIHFSAASCVRAIPCVCDGMKPSQRKILYGAFKRNLKQSIKVSQFAGYVSEHTSYHSGEASLHGTIINMAQDYIGSNNVNLFVPEGQFGTRLMGGKDASSPRYIFTKLEEITRVLFNPYDNPLLEYLDDDGVLIEPKYYLPILPTVLINGCEGIGTGYSTKIPSFNPLDIIKNIRRKMKGKKMVEMKPWFRDFTGEVIKMGAGRYMIKGVCSKLSDTEIEITELPVGMWTNDYKEFLDKLMIDKNVKSFVNQSSDIGVYFKVCFADKAKFKKDYANLESFYEKMKLTKTIKISNMHLFNHSGKIASYEKINDIIEEFYPVRIEYYGKRKDYLVVELQKELDIIKYKVRFIEEVIAKKLVIFNKKKEVVYGLLEKGGYPLFAVGKEEKASYDYLMNIKVWHFTKEQIDKLRNERDMKEAMLKELIDKTVVDLWNDDIDEFIEEYEKFLKVKKDNKSDK
jgi:DNA topoisomerase-2